MGSEMCIRDSSTPSHTLGGHTRRMGGSGALRPSSRVKALESFGRGRVITKNHSAERPGFVRCHTALSARAVRGPGRFRDGALREVVFVLRSSSVRRMYPTPSGATLGRCGSDEAGYSSERCKAHQRYDHGWLLQTAHGRSSLLRTLIESLCAPFAPVTFWHVIVADYVRTRRPAVLRCLHAIDARRRHQTRSWSRFGPRRGCAVAAMASS